MTSRKGFTLIELMIVIAIIAVIAAIAIPGLLAAQRSSNERNASASMKTLATAEADFRSNDRDGNSINDFWTGDVSFLCLGVALTGSPPVPPAAATINMNTCMKLLEISIAAADGNTTSAGVAYVAAMHVGYAAGFGTFQDKSGYTFFSMLDDRTGGVIIVTRVDTDVNASFLACHSLDRFAFAAFPRTLNSGKLAFIVNQDNTIFKRNLLGTYTCVTAGIGTAGPTDTTIANSGFTFTDGANAMSFPDSPLSTGWGKMD